MLKNVTPSWGCLTPHIFKYCQLLDISGNYEWISMKFSGISPMARGRKVDKNNTKIYYPLGLPRQPQPPNSKTGGISANYEPISTQFSEISVPTCWQRIGKKMLKNATPLGAVPPPSYFQILSITWYLWQIWMNIDNIFRNYSTGLEKKNMWRKYQNMSPSPGAAPGSPTPNYKTCVISANYEPISTKFSGISVPTSWQGMDEKYVEKCHPLFGLPHPHIFKYCQLLDITDNNERISMKFSGISLLARRRKRVKKIPKFVTPSWGCPSSPNLQF